MTYTSFSFYVFLVIALVAYYVIPKAYRWLAILLANFCFVWFASESISKLVFFAGTIVVSYLFGLLLEKRKNKTWLFAGILISACPLLIDRLLGFIEGKVPENIVSSIVIPLGLSFYTMQIIAYLVDIYRGKIKPQNNFFKYALFISFFPQIIQGPIPRYDMLSDQLIEGHAFNEKDFLRGIQLIIWGFFLKFMIADKAGVVVNTIFDDYNSYKGLYIWIAGILYSLQLYTDFLGCVTLSQGIAQLFGINLMDNFKHPYFSDSIKDFWRRWHISLSSWLRDYIYIPLGGNRKGTYRKNINLLVTFAVSGLWHGGGIKFIFWGLMHGVYQLIEGLVPILQKKYEGAKRFLRILVNFYFVMIAWIVFRADDLKAGLKMIYRMFKGFNPWIFFDGAIYDLGLVQREWEVLILSILVLFWVSRKQEAGIVIRERFEQRALPVRWFIYILAIVVIWVFGTYGFGYDATDFIYGGF
ncbi:hypothetical protein CSX00_06210 [Pseudobutyrivibrio ruminis]|uniref:Membrane-bound O-acyltransferase family protein n=1 Tax=Pseudobutyrivibrio ruminis TaxID=46206 RepID=A0A2G3EAW3_9FIRM|nr:MBOAT family O-acyltransferase [Pseudobutyrivibrio ruminis]PHU40360.1 hypothetical protein CSX00_06210 [Pseudobutyrivibrio ruminis]